LNFPLGLPLFAAVLRAAALPGWALGPAALFFAVPRIAWWERGGGWKGDLLGGVLFWTLAFSYLGNIFPVQPLGPGLIVGPLWVLEGFLYRRLRRRAPACVAGPLALCASCFLRQIAPLGGVPVAGLALGFADLAPARWLAAAVGEMGLDALILFAGGWLYGLARPQRGAGLLAAPLLLVVAAVLAAANPPLPAPTGRVSCLAVQPNLSIDIKVAPMTASQVFRANLDLMVASWEAGERPEIVFWAETMYPYSMLAPGAQGVLRRPRRYGDRDYEIPVDLERQIQKRALGEIARWIRPGGFFVTGSHLWEGVPAEAGPGAYSVHTSEMVAFDRERRMVAHRPKSRLVPFGEFLPLASWLPDSREIARIIFRNVGLLPDLTERPPEGPLHLTLPGEDVLLLGSAVCWENPFESIFRSQALQGAEAFCVLSNEGWFGLGAEMDQMEAATRFRAAETGRAVLRVTNTGLTLWIDAHGAVRQALPRGEAGWLAVSLPRTPRGYRNVYLRGGWLFLPALAALAALLVLLSWLPGSSTRRLDPPIGPG